MHYLKKMKETHCPLCYTELIVRDTSPCMECGADEFEQDHYKDHEYKEYELYFGQRLILCDFCDVDFGSYDPTYFGFPKGKRVGLEDWNFIKDVTDKELRKDKYCPNCNHRLAFLKFLDVCRKNANRH